MDDETPSDKETKSIYQSIDNDLSNKTSVFPKYVGNQLDLYQLCLIWDKYPEDESMRKLIFHTEEQYLDECQLCLDECSSELQSIELQIPQIPSELDDIIERFNENKRLKEEENIKHQKEAEEKRKQEEEQKVSQVSFVDSKPFLEKSKKIPNQNQSNELIKKQEDEYSDIQPVLPMYWGRLHIFPSGIDISKYNFIHPNAFSGQVSISNSKDNTGKCLNLNSGLHESNFLFPINKNKTYRIQYEANSSHSYKITQTFFYECYDSYMEQIPQFSKEKRWNQDPATVTKKSTDNGKNIIMNLKFIKEKWNFIDDDKKKNMDMDFYLSINNRGHTYKISTFDYSSTLFTKSLKIPDKDGILSKSIHKNDEVSIKKGSHYFKYQTNSMFNNDVFGEKSKNEFYILPCNQIIKDIYHENHIDENTSYIRVGILVECSNYTALQIHNFKITQLD